jgi:hypothetical protein
LTSSRPRLLLPLLVALFPFSLSGAAQAYGPYTGGASGTDVSYPQCSQGLPGSPQSFAIIGVSGGRAFYQNPCLISEFSWGQSAPTPVSFFMNLNEATGSTAFKGNSGPKGSCAANDDVCHAYNYGWNDARLAYADAQSQETSASMWWLDVETDNDWSDNLPDNAQVIQGAIDYLKSQGRTVGIYSTAKQWGEVAGNFSPGLPVWVAGAPDANSAPGYCAQSYAFGGGSIWLVQIAGDDFDTDYACSPQSASGTQIPANFQATATNATTVQIQWTAPGSNVSVYLIYDGGVLVGQPAGSATSFTVPGLKPGSYHCYTMTAESGSSYSGYTPWSCLTLPSS